VLTENVNPQKEKSKTCWTGSMYSRKVGFVSLCRIFGYSLNILVLLYIIFLEQPHLATPIEKKISRR
jgi:hypothetical protein